jgi:acylphosphatase
MSFIGAVVNVRGVVQGVGFRYWCRGRAKEIGVRGYAANLHDGSVEVAFEGERGLVESFINELKVGPTYSHIADIKIEWYDSPKGYDDFRIILVD